MGWDYAKIRDRWQKEAETTLAGLSREELIAKVVDLQTALEPFVTTLGSLDDKLDWPRAGMNVSSKLFPMLDADGRSWLVFNSEKRASDTINPLLPEDLHKVEYYTEDSLSFDKDQGGKLHDDFEIIGVHQQALASYIFCGQITMKDVRHAASALKNGERT